MLEKAPRPVAEKAYGYYSLFGMSPVYKIDKANLKKAYYNLSKEQHPDRQGHGASNLNAAYKALNDDFCRAKLFSSPASSVSQEFLISCLDLEERIRQGEDLKEELENKIKECKAHYNSPEWLAKWGYYKRLYDIANTLL